MGPEAAPDHVPESSGTWICRGNMMPTRTERALFTAVIERQVRSAALLNARIAVRIKLFRKVGHELASLYVFS
jgi:hypothetical protein